jgi:outer membrane protein
VTGLRAKPAGGILLLALQASLAPAQSALTLDEARQLALRHHPAIAAAGFRAQASGAVVNQVKSAYQPLLTGNLTTAGADTGSTIAAGMLQTSALSTRAATGIGLSQLITDFGRTSHLSESARLRAVADGKNVDNLRAQVLLQVEQAYYSALAADAVLNVAKARLEMQQVTLRQVRALAESSMKSTLDVSFAEVAVSEAEMALYQAENGAQATRAQLAAAFGDEKERQFDLVDVPLPGPLMPDVDTLVAEALQNRPDLSVAKFTNSAAEQAAAAERKLRYPAISFVAAAGVIPFHNRNLPDQYTAAGVNISIPFLNGGLFGARMAEAEYRARAAAKDSEALAVQIAAAVRVAWLDANNAWRRLEVTARLVDQTTTSLRLAKSRYDLGLSGILELTQAQLSLTSAQTSAANAKYDYLTRVANLNFATGAYR